MKKDSKEKNKRWIGVVVLAATLLLIIVLFFATGVYKNVFEFLGFDVNREYKADGIAVEFTPHGKYEISCADNTIMIFDETGVTGYDNAGGWKWHSDAKFAEPVLQSYDGFVLVHDATSKIVTAFNSKGVMWSKTFNYPVRNAVAHNGTGFVSVITDSEDYNSEIFIIDYKNDLKDIFSGKFVDEFIVNVSVAPDCSQFALTGFYPEGEKTSGVIMFLRMSDGEVFSTEVFDEIYPYAEYLNGSNLIAANSDSLLKITKTASVDTKKDKIKALWKRESNSEKLLGIDTIINEGFCVSFGNSDDTSEKSTVKFFDKKGELKQTKSFSERVDFVKAGYDSFLLSSDYSVYLMGKSFKQKSSYGSMSDIENAGFITGEKVLVEMQSRLMIVSFTEK